MFIVFIRAYFHLQNSFRFFPHFKKKERAERKTFHFKFSLNILQRLNLSENFNINFHNLIAKVNNVKCVVTLKID